MSQWFFSVLIFALLNSGVMRTFAITFILYVSYETNSNLKLQRWPCFLFQDNILFNRVIETSPHIFNCEESACFMKTNKQLMKICLSPLMIPCLVRVSKVGKLSVQQRVQEPQQDMKCGSLWCKFNKLPQRCPSVTVYKFVTFSLQGFYCF